MSQPESVLQAFEATSAVHGSAAALRYKHEGAWQAVSWSEYRQQVETVGRALIALGIEAGETVVILADNSPRWFFAHFGSIAVGAVPTGLYTNNTSEQCEFIAHHCEAVVAFAGSLRHLRTILAIRHRLPRLRAIVLMEGEAALAEVHSWSALEESAGRISDAAYRERCEALESDGVCELIYTSGTTGRPKGVMLTHRNILWLAQQVLPFWGLRPGESLISYLPLSHIAEQVISLYSPIFSGTCTWFAESLERLGDNLREIRPHVFFAVPRVWEKIQAVIEAGAARRSGLERALGRWARRQGLAAGLAEQDGRPRPPLSGLANRLFFTKVHRQMGLDRCRQVFTSAAPISLHTLEFFLSLGVPVLEVYGMSECTGPTTLSTRDHYRTGKAGRAIPGTEIRIADDGEILIRGPHTTPGYFKDPASTRETIDDEGWLHSGDIGEIDSEGYLTVTDRKKELIITSGGKNVAPQPIEGLLRAIPLVAQAVVVGDERNYLTALLTLDPERLPSQAAAIGSAARDLASAARCEHIRRHLEERIEAINRGLARFETIKRFHLLPLEFTVEGGELTPTMKLKRRVIRAKYAADIEALYR